MSPTVLYSIVIAANTITAGGLGALAFKNVKKGLQAKAAMKDLDGISGDIEATRKEIDKIAAALHGPQASAQAAREAFRMAQAALAKHAAAYEAAKADAELARELAETAKAAAENQREVADAYRRSAAGSATKLAEAKADEMQVKADAEEIQRTADDADRLLGQIRARTAKIRLENEQAVKALADKKADIEAADKRLLDETLKAEDIDAQLNPAPRKEANGAVSVGRPGKKPAPAAKA